MRTRMYGGVRGRGLAAPSYSIKDVLLHPPSQSINRLTGQLLIQATGAL